MTTQIMPTITLSYGHGDNGALGWAVTVSDGEHATEPMTVSPETAAGIADAVDVALPLPLDLGSGPTSAEKLVRTAIVQTLEAALAQAKKGLSSVTVPGAEAAVPAEVKPGPAAPKKAAPRRKSSAKRRPASTSSPAEENPTHDNAGFVEEGAALSVVRDGPALETVTPGDVAPPPADEPPPASELPEKLPRRSHLTVPDVEEY